MNLLEHMDHVLWKQKQVVYCYTNKINNKKYVGQTSRSLKVRHKAHVVSANNSQTCDYNTPLHRAFRKYGISNFELQVLHIGDEYSLHMLESHYIHKWDLLSKHGRGYNLMPGGFVNNPYAGKTEEEILEIGRKIGLSRKGKYCGELNPFYGKKHSQETKEKMSKALKGKQTSSKNPNAKKVVQLSKQGKYIATWECITDASRQVGANATDIVNCCKGKQNTTNDYIWVYADEYSRISEDELKNIVTKANKQLKGKFHPRAKSVVQLTKEGVYVKTWEYIKQASAQLGIGQGDIINCCKGKYKSAGGFVWHYLEEYKEETS